jgi:hypothetical protein
MLGAGNIVTNEVTNKMSGNEKSAYVTSKKTPLPLENKLITGQI